MRESNRKIFQQRLIQVMSELETNQTGLAKMLNVTQQTVQQWIAGRSQPRMEQLDRLSEAVGKPVYWFFMPIDMDTEVNPQGHNKKVYEVEAATKGIALSQEEEKIINIYRDLPGEERKNILQELTYKIEAINNFIIELRHHKNK
ncbi:helix-turn-helix domain-containing protein [Salmonella enterica]|nr:helix-turn-helix domain-containing protein [Salmonella enterica]